MLAPFSPRSTTPLRVMLKVPAISYSPAAKTTAPVALSSAAWMRDVLSPAAGVSRSAAKADGSFTPPPRYPAAEKSMMPFPRSSIL
jgi:hypothetical protein